MSIEKAIMIKLRFTSANHNGLLTSEDLTDLSLEHLDLMAQTLRTELKRSGAKSFIHKGTKKDELIKLRFEVVKRIIEIKLNDIENIIKATEIRQHNKKIRERIAIVKNEGLDGLSIEELEKLIK